MSTLKTNTISNVAGTSSTDVLNVINGSAKAWVVFVGTSATSPFTEANGGIKSSFNVSSVTDNGTGTWTCNFTNAFSDAEYCVAGFSRNTLSTTPLTICQTGSLNTKTTTACGVVSSYMNSGTVTNTDSSAVCVVFFR